MALYSPVNIATPFIVGIIIVSCYEIFMTKHKIFQLYNRKSTNIIHFLLMIILINPQLCKKPFSCYTVFFDIMVYTHIH